MSDEDAGRPGIAVVAIGGGHGLANTLRAVRRFASSVTAVVSVADDGGSSGRLREALGAIPPGDLRKCLLALGEEGTVWSKAFEHRFSSGELEGHALGNLVIAGLIESTDDVLGALDEAGRLLGSVGRVLPATTTPVTLEAQAACGRVRGQVAIGKAGQIRELAIAPPDAESPEEAVKAIAVADQVVIGPGSLFTSVIAAAIAPAIREAIASTPAAKIYVCNLRPQASETDGYDVAAHVRALQRHGIAPDAVLADPTHLGIGDCPVPVVARALANRTGYAHDPERLAAALADLVG